MSNVFRPVYRELKEEEISLINNIKDKAQELYGIFEKCENGREQSLAKTKLEEAIMWIVKAITTS